MNPCFTTQSTRGVTLVLSQALAIALLLASAPALAQIDTAANSDPNSADDLGILNINEAILNQATLSPVNDVDFFSNSLSTLDVFMGMTTPIAALPGNFGAPDTILKLIVPQPLPAKDVIFSDNDGGGELPGGANRGSLFRFVAPMGGQYPVGISGQGDLEFDGANTGAGHAESGDYYLAVSGSDDLDFDGLAGGIAHGEIGNYAVLVSVFGDPEVVPEPTALALAAIGLLSLGACARRRRMRA